MLSHDTCQSFRCQMAQALPVIVGPLQALRLVSTSAPAVLKVDLRQSLSFYPLVSFNLISQIIFCDSFITMHLEQASRKMFFVVNFLTIQSGLCKSQFESIS